MSEHRIPERDEDLAQDARRALERVVVLCGALRERGYCVVMTVAPLIGTDLHVFPEPGEMKLRIRKAVEI